MTPEQQAELSEKKARAGRLGYQKALANNPDFHQLGGNARAEYYEGWNCPCHGISLAGYLAHGNKLKKNKPHRWRGERYR